MAISGWFVLLLVVGVLPTAILGDPVVAALWCGGAVILGIIDLVIAGSPRQVSISRDLPGRLRLGDSAPSILTIANTGRRTVRGIVRDGWSPSAGARPTRVRMTVPPGERRSRTFTLQPFRRGERGTRHVTIRSFGPLRLWARQATLSAPGALLVLPPFNSRKHLPSRLARLRELDGATSVMVRGQGTEFDSLRDYVRGDDVRSIDWRATARRNDPTSADGRRLVVRTWRPERDRRVVILIDSGRTSAARIDNEPRIDTAFESALLLAALASGAGDRVDLVIFDRRVRGRVQGATGAELLSRMVTSMAPVEPELIDMDWSSVPGIVRSVTSHSALVVLATAIDAPGASRGLLSVLPQLTRKHTVVVSSVTDPAVLEATLQRGTRDEVYDAAAAERALLDQARVATAIRQLGGDVVTGSPQDLPPALADRYIALKAAGRL
ncbi:uncharacterized protein (DUF58 family) [Microbacteriaceae bacterium SG_E_30_P1]|uniref:Uncharacterized protein (DUF58 family) n=1 Tax=Antiquaquibacter oligotrophicus TaxID=2880260 RepID=A0ABT6KNT3_9MICO|nr:DUF58 domain-containing protein [Antiquaquibacter oligotrophicus]MDH6181655.1 uncharacterized protein (DUF58 family) [Antiquaquibacter oligotrophicus]UDF12661.1 DUF58 domain-containing protein [Antiquaquibacter oligotrophicus]